MIRATIDGMSCPNCVRHVTEALTALEGVTQVEVTLEPGQAQIQTSVDVPDSAIRQALDEEGYDVTAIHRT
jgi:copper chaperone CopZ